MNFRQGLRHHILHKNQLNVSPTMYQAMPDWLKRQSNATYTDLQATSRADFESRQAAPQPHLFLGLVLFQRYSRELSGYADQIRPFLADAALQGRLLSVLDIADGLDIPEDEFDIEELSLHLEAASDYDGAQAAASMIESYDLGLQEAIRRAIEEGQHLEGRALTVFVVAAITAWHDEFTQRQSALAAVTESGRGFGEGWRETFNDNPRMKTLTVVTVVPDYHCPRCTLCGDALSGNPWTYQELESSLGIPPGDYHPNCIHSIQFERYEGYENQVVNIGGRAFRL